MSQRHNHRPSMKRVTCNKCLTDSYAVPGKTHRRCPGGPNQEIRPKHQGIVPAASRGHWE